MKKVYLISQTRINCEKAISSNQLFVLESGIIKY